MDVEIFSLCDHAQKLEGKLIIVGVFDTMWANELPTTSKFSIAIRVRFEEEELGEHKLKVEFKSPDGNHLVDISADLNLKKTDEKVDYITINQTFSVNFKFKEAGQYWAEFQMDDEKLASRPINLYKRDK